MKRIKVLLASLTVCASGVALADGTITGTAAFEGALPEAKRLPRTTDPICKQFTRRDEPVQVTKEGKLRNVVVRLRNAPAGEVPAEPVILTQEGCMFSPRVVAAVAGQRVQVNNNDATYHRVEARDPANDKSFTRLVPLKSSHVDMKYTQDSDALKLSDPHCSMSGYLVFSKTPYFAITGEDGSFKLKGVPPGTYTVEALHETLGTRTAEVTVVDGQSTPVAFSFQAPR